MWALFVNIEKTHILVVFRTNCRSQRFFWWMWYLRVRENKLRRTALNKPIHQNNPSREADLKHLIKFQIFIRFLFIRFLVHQRTWITFHEHTINRHRKWNVEHAIKKQIPRLSKLEAMSSGILMWCTARIWQKWCENLDTCYRRQEDTLFRSKMWVSSSMSEYISPHKKKSHVFVTRQESVYSYTPFWSFCS